MKNNNIQNKFNWAYLIGFFIILALPLFNLPPWFYPPDWGKAIVFRSIIAIFLFLFLYQLLYRKNELSLSDIKKNKIIWALIGLFGVFLLASIFSVDPYFSFWGSPYRGGGFMTFAFYFVFAVLAFILFKKNDPSTDSGLSWKKAWIFSIIIGLLVCVIALFQFYGIFNKIFISVGSRPGSTIGNPIFLGIYLLLLFFPTLSFAIKESFGEAQDRKNKYLKIFYIFSLLIFLYVIFIAGSRAAYLGIFTGILFFLLAYPKKLKLLKICLGLFLIFVASIVFYVNTQSHFPQILEKNRIFVILQVRLSIKSAFNDERYKAWQTVLKEVEDRPILGWGPENLAVGFDKFYDPNVTTSPWWDKAHNVFLDIGAQTGILGILAYLALFVALFWQLQKNKRKTEDESRKVIINGIQATLAGYLVANFFSFDSFASYLIFFFIIGYSLHLTSSNSAEITLMTTQKNAEGISNNQRNNQREISGKTPLKQTIKYKKTIITISFILLVLFLWQYNLAPFQITKQINIADNLINGKKCNQALNLMDKLLSKHSFVDSYLIMRYVSNLKTCAGYYPEKDLAYAQKGVPLLNEAVKIQPLYTRYWLYFGSFTTVIANSEQNPQIKQDLISRAYSYFDKAETLSPLHTEIFLERAKTDLITENYQGMKQNAERCINIKPDIGYCYWIKSLAELYMNDQQNAEKDSQAAANHGFDINSPGADFQLIDVYIKTEQYDKLAGIYEKFIAENRGYGSSAENTAQYHSSLALAYSKMGQYKKAREQAMIFLKLMPGAKDEVNAFLQTLPY